MKINKKFIASATSAALVASAIVPVASAASFSDIENNTHKDAILALAEAGIISGYTDGTFKPNAQVTRGNVTKLLGKWLVSEGYDIPADYNTVERFTDVPVTHADQELVKYAALVKDAGVFNGSNGQLMQANNMSREQMAVVLVRAIKTVYGIDLIADYKAANFESEITDFDQAIADYHESITALEFAGLTTQKTFNPKGTVTRGQFASFLNRAIEYAAKQEVAKEVKVESVSAVNGTLTVKLAEAATEVSVEDFTVTQAINGGTATEVTPSKAELAEDGLTVTLTVDEVVAQETTEQSVVYTVNEVAADAFVVEVSTLAVKSVVAINAATLKVTFTQKLDAKSLFADSTAQEAGDLIDSIITFGGVDLGTTAKYFAELSEDGKSIIFTAKDKTDAFASTTATKTVVKVADEVIKAANGALVPAYEELISTVDTVAPTVVSATNKNAATTLVKFSESVDITNATANLELSSGKIVAVTLTPTDDASEYTITLPSELAAGKTGTVSVVGVQDYAGNLVNPNPSTFTVTKGQADEVAPTVTSVTQTGAKEFTVQFSEELQNTETELESLITVTDQSAGATTVSNVEQDSTDKTKYVVTVNNVLDKISTVTFAVGLKDLTGTATDAAITKVVSFTKDTTAPVVSSYTVEQDATTGKEYLVLTFDKNVDLSSAKATATTGSTYTYNYITKSFTAAAADLNYVDQDDSKKVVRVALDALLADSDVENASYSVKLAFTGVTSESAVAVNTTTVKFTRTNDTVASNNAKLEVSDIEAVEGENSKIKVTFNHAVDGETATTASNYTVQGATVESVVLTDSKTAVLTLAANSNKNTGLLNVTVANVKNYDKTRVLTTTTKAVNLTENVAPTYTAALTGTNKITLTFSEAVTSSTELSGVINGDDFVVYVNGSKVTATATDVAYGKSVNTLELTLAEAVTDLSHTITVKASDSADVVDAKAVVDSSAVIVGNALSTATVTVTK